MSLFDTVRNLGASVASGLQKQAARYTGAAATSRMSAVIAMMAYLPDGDADENEILTGVQAINTKMGDVFRVAELVKMVNADVAVLRQSKRLGKADLMQRIRGAADDAECRWLVTVAAAVGESDPLEARAAGGPREDPFSPAERALASEIATTLNVDPAEIGI